MADSARAIKAAFQGRYEILESLGAGGFGNVYRALQVATGQTVAMKVLRLVDSEAADARERRIARFQREMQICSQIYHPNIVRLMDSGHTPEGIVFSVFEFVPGKNLAEVLAEEGCLDPVEARHFFMQVLDALACAHASGIVHRDLKPANLMVTPTGARRNVLVLDFGIGAISEEVALHDGDRITMTNEFVGTPSYTAPEQLLGRPPTWRSDLYSWGLCFLEALSGKRVIDGTTMPEVVFKQLSPDPVPIPDSLAHHPLGGILRRATAKDADARDVTAESLLHELEAYDVSTLKDWTRPVRLAPAPPTTVNVRTGVQHSTRPRLVQGERRQVTAVCCLLGVPETDANHPDVEELDQRLATLQEAISEVVAIHDGHVAGVLGDTIVYYFGYPVAREDDAYRAARAALAIAADVARKTGGAGQPGSPDLRIGIHTGFVVARELRDGTVVHGYVGGTPARARALATTAPPGGIIASGATQRLLRKEFVFDDLDPASASQRPPSGVYLLQGRRASPGARGAPLVGREREVDVLVDHWELARGGTGQAVLVTGEAGIGKSRLARELDARLKEVRHGWLECRCTPDTANTPFYPIVELLERTLDPAREATAEARLERLEALLSRFEFDLDEAVPVFASLLSLPLDKGPKARPPLDVSPQKLTELTRNAVLSLLFGMAEKEPLVLFVEDLHWADSSTLELLAQLVSEVGTARVVALLTARPEFESPFSRSQILLLQLARLGREDIDQMAVKVTLGRALPSEVLEAVAARTDGVPLFVEEIILAMVETGALVESEGRYELAMPLAEVAIPATLRDSLVARLDRLDRAKETAQIAAAIGREFGFELLSAVSPLDPREAQEDLDRLVAAELVYRRRRPKSATYFFKHALVRDAAYESMLTRSQQQVHARIAEALERHFPDVVAERPDLVARHHAAAQQPARAIPYAIRAASAALGRSAYAEALALGKEALGWVAGLSDERARKESELAINCVIAPALMASQGYATAQTGAVLERSSALIAALGDVESESAFQLLWASVLYHYGRADLKTASDCAQTFLDRAVQSKDRSRQVAGFALLGQCRLSTGHLEEACTDLNEAVRLFDPVADRTHAVTYGLDTRILALAYLGLAMSMRGRLNEAAKRQAEARAWARELGARHATCAMLFGLACAHHIRGERAPIASISDEMRQVVSAYGFSFYVPMTELIRAWAERNLPAAEGILGQMAAFGGVASFGVWVSMVAELLGENGREEEAVAKLDERIAHHDDGSTYYVPELLRLKGELLLRVPATRERGKVALREAIGRARELGAPFFELRAAHVLAGALIADAKEHDARKLLADVLPRIGEGEEHPLFSSARETLARLVAKKTA